MSGKNAIFDKKQLQVYWAILIPFYCGYRFTASAAPKAKGCVVGLSKHALGYASGYGYVRGIFYCL